MKKIIFYLLLIVLAYSCTDNSDTQQHLVGAQTKLSGCDTFYKQVSYDSTWEYSIDSCYPNRLRWSWRKHSWVFRKDSSCISVTRTGHMEKFKIVVDTIICHYDTTKTTWGIKIQQDKFENQLSVAKQLGVKAVRPNSIGVMDFNGDLGNVPDWINEAFIPVININVSSDNTQKPFHFVEGADTVIYKQNLEKIFSAIEHLYQPFDEVTAIAIIDNEPTNAQYYIWNSAAYIHQVKMAVVIAHAHHIRIADGCTHLEAIELIRTNKWQNSDVAIRQKTLLDAWKNIDLDFVDFHTHWEITKNKPTGYPVLSLATTINFLETYTGRTAITNEWSEVGGNGVVVKWFTDGYKEALIPYAVAFSGDGVGGNSDGDAYNIGTVITPIIGFTYKTEINK